MINFNALDRYTEPELLALAERCADRDEETAAVAEWALDLHEQVRHLEKLLAASNRDLAQLTVTLAAERMTRELEEVA